MSDIVYCKDCAYAEPNNLDAYHSVKIGVFCTRYKQNTIGIHGCDNGKPKAKTNADRIRNMTDEELADFICKTQFAFIPKSLGNIPISVYDCMSVLEWLKQEVGT